MLGGMNAWQWETEDCSVASVPGPGVAPAALSLGPAVPNPFSLETEISYAIPAENGPLHVTLNIYDSRGRLVARVVDDDQDAGGRRVVWNGTDQRGRPVASGVYFYRLASNGKTEMRRVVLLR
jgi:flagellar hook assembly protein FlgD